MFKNKARLSEKILALRREGYTFSEISQKINISLSLVYILAREIRKKYGEQSLKTTKRRTQLQIMKKAEKLASKGLSVGEIAEKCSISSNTLYNWISKNEQFKYNGTKPKQRSAIKIDDNASPNQRRIFEEYNRDTGATIREIARKVNLSYQTVYKNLKLAGVNFKQKRCLTQ